MQYNNLTWHLQVLDSIFSNVMSYWKSLIKNLVYKNFQISQQDIIVLVKLVTVRYLYTVQRMDSVAWHIHPGFESLPAWQSELVCKNRSLKTVTPWCIVHIPYLGQKHQNATITADQYLLKCTNIGMKHICNYGFWGATCRENADITHIGSK